MTKNGKTLGVSSNRTNGKATHTGGTSRRQDAARNGNVDFPTDFLGDNGILDYNRRYGF